MPSRRAGSPLPPRVHSPARKSVLGAGSGSGSQRIRLGSGTASVNGPPCSVPFPVRTKAGWAAEGRMR